MRKKMMTLLMPQHGRPPPPLHAAAVAVAVAASAVVVAAAVENVGFGTVGVVAFGLVRAHPAHSTAFSAAQCVREHLVSAKAKMMSTVTS